MNGAENAHANNIGAIRLLLAYAVIASHSPELLGQRTHEPLVRFGAHLTLGEIAVDGFFIISGYLITSSYLSKRRSVAFLKSRIRRIYPAYVIASLICIAIVAPLSGAAMLDFFGLLSGIGKALLLLPPDVPGTFPSLTFHALNGSMWSIRYEFKCYLLVLILGLAGLLDRRTISLWFTGGLAAAFLYSHIIGFPVVAPGPLHQFIYGVIGDPVEVVRLAMIFMAGVCFRLYRDQVKPDPALSFLAACVVVIAVFATSLGELAIAVAGSYVLVWLALYMRSSILRHINNSYDFSYGTYLYAWPIASLAIVGATHIGVRFTALWLTLFTISAATIAGAISWYAIEKRAMSFEFGKRIAERSAHDLLATD